MIGYNLGTGRPKIIQMVDCSNTQPSQGSTYNHALNIYISTSDF